MDSKPFRTTRTLVNLRQGRNDWYRIKNADGGGPAQLHIYDEIGYFGVTAQDLIRDLAGVKGALEVHLNTPGGEVFDGIAVYNALKQHDGPVTVIVDSLAASIGSVIAMAADPGNMIVAKNASMMIHDGFGMAIGNAADMRELAGLLDKTSDNIASIYADRTGKPAAVWRAAMLAETWYVGQEAVDAGLADRLLGAETPEPAVVVQGSWDLSIFARRPNPVVDSDDPDAPFDPDGDGDDDSTPEGDTDHDHWAPDGTQLKSVPGKPMPPGTPEDVFDPSAVRAADESSWDGGAAMSACAKSDNPAAAYKSICAGRRDGDPGKQSSWALPHHAHPGDGPNAAGVRNALARLPQTQGLTNKQAAESHLQAHMSAISPGDSNGSGPGDHVHTGFMEITDEEFENIRAALEEQ